MPLLKGNSRAVIAHNISKEMHAGKSQRQSIAIAMSQAGMHKDPAHRIGTVKHGGEKIPDVMHRANCTKIKC